MIIPSVNLIARQCQNSWRSTLFRTIMITHRRQLATGGQSKKDNESLVQSTSTDNQVEVATFKEKGELCDVFQVIHDHLFQHNKQQKIQVILSLLLPVLQPWVVYVI